MKRHKPVLLVKFGVRENLASRLYFLRLVLDSRLDDENGDGRIRNSLWTPWHFLGKSLLRNPHRFVSQTHYSMRFAADTNHGGAL